MLFALVHYYMSKYVSHNKEVVPMLMKAVALVATSYSLIYIEERIKKNQRKKEEV